MTDTVSFSAQTRDLGTKASRRLREGGRLPAIVYGHREDVVPISLDYHEVEVALAHGARTLDVVLGDKTQRCLIKDVQLDYLGTSPIHLDLTRVDEDERVNVNVGIELKGVPKGAMHGGVMDQHLTEIEVECRVVDIPETLHPLVAHLEVGESLLVKDLDLPQGVTAITNAEDRIATVHALAQVAEDDEPGDEEEGAGGEEPQRIGRVRKDEEEADKKS